MTHATTCSGDLSQADSPIPIYLVFVTVTIWEGYFRSETIRLGLTHGGLQASETALADVKEYLASIDDARDWLDGDARAPLLPERFRIEVQDQPLGLQVQCYWLRWEDAGAVGERIKARIFEALPDARFTVSGNVDRSDYVRVSVNRVARPWFLDGRIHWR